MVGAEAKHCERLKGKEMMEKLIIIAAIIIFADFILGIAYITLEVALKIKQRMLEKEIAELEKKVRDEKCRK